MPIAFADVARRTQLGRLRGAAERALTAYALEGASLRLVLHEFNATYRVDHDGQRFALRINTNSPHGVAAVQAEAAWVDAIRTDTELLVPEPVRTADGGLSTAVEVDGLDGQRGAVLYRWLDGPDLGEQVSLRRFREVGRAAAILHEHTATWTHPTASARPRLDSVLLDEPDHITGDPRITERDGAVLAATRRELERVLAPVFSGPRQLIHADLHVWNTKWVQGRVAVLDFDDCGYGSPLQDLAISAYYLSDRAGTVDALLDGYADVRPVPDHTAEQFTALVASRNLLLLNSILPHVTAGMDDFLPGYLERTVTRLQRWLDTGIFEL